MNKFYLLFATVILSFNAVAQGPAWQWSKGIGGSGNDVGISITTDADGNIYTTGTFVGNVDFDPGAGAHILHSIDPLVIDIFVSKMDSAGNFIWAKSFGGATMDMGRSIVVDPSGSGAVYFAGYFNGTADFDPNPGVFNLTTTSAFYSDIFICKLDTSGNFLWAKGMGGIKDDGAFSLTVDPSNGSVYCSGSFNETADFDPGAGIFNLTSAGYTDIFVSKYDSSGNFVWAKAIGGTGFDQDNGITRIPSGTDLYATGYFAGSVDFDPGAGINTITSAGIDDIYVSKLDSSGNFIWTKTMGGTSGDVSNSIATDVAGNVYLTGRFNSVADFDPGAGVYNLISASMSDDIFVSKLDSSGNFEWAKQMGGGTSLDMGNSIVLDSAGGVYTAGIFIGAVDFDPGPGVNNLITVGNNHDMFISCLDNSGNFVWVKQAGGVNGENCRAMAMDGTGHICMTGFFSSPTITFGTNTFANAGLADIFITRLDSTMITTETFTYELFDQFPISIFPNPFTDELTVNSSETGELKIYDISGRIVFTEKLISFDDQRINADWQQGIYFIEVNTDAGRVVKKVVKY